MLIHKNLPVIAFANQAQFENWLEKNYTQETGIWIRFYKVDSKIETISTKDAVQTAICWGWIDGLINKYDDVSYLLKFTPRRPKSVWSKINVENVEKLIKEGRMKSSGLQKVEEAKLDGRWDRAYEPPSKMEVPADFLDLVKQDFEAYSFYQTLNKTYLYSIAFRLVTTINQQKREEKKQAFLAMLKNKSMKF